MWYLVPDGVVQYIAKHQLYPRDGSTRTALGLRSRPTIIPSNESAA